MSPRWGDDDFTGSDKFAVKLSSKEIKKMKKDAEKERKKRTSGMPDEPHVTSPT